MTAALTLIVFEIAAMICVAFAIPLLRRQVPPNRWFGFRTPSTVRDPALWYEVNYRAGVDLLVTGLLLAACAAILFVAEANLSVFWIVCTILLGFGPIYMTIHGFMVIRRSRRD